MSDELTNDNNEFWERQQQIYKKAYVTWALLACNVIIFFISSLFYGKLYSLWAMYTPSVLMDGEFYRIITATFMHADINHLFNNMLMLVLAGAIIEQYMGHGLYLIMYLLAGIFGNILSMAYEINNDLNWISVGASGSVMGIVGFMVIWIVIFRRQLARDRSMLLRLLLLGFFVIESCFFQKGANTVAHLGGFLTGFVFGIINIILFNNRKNMEGIV